jgi:precorrin-2 dehydrogenase/sirohydrochlorin ferrochelatase
VIRALNTEKGQPYSMKKTEQALPYYPISLSIRGKKCVVVGGGQVALRKVEALLACGADIEVIGTDTCPELTELKARGQIVVLHRRYRPGDLRKAFMAIAATDSSDINQQVVNEARQKSVLVNVVDDPADSDFIVPSCLRRGRVTIAVSTDGKSPALARKIRTRLEKDFGEEYASLVNLISEVRAEVKRQGIKVSSDDWQEALDLDLMIDLLRKGDTEKARSILLNNLNRDNVKTS